MRKMLRVRSYVSCAMLSVAVGLFIGLVTPASLPERVVSGVLAIPLFMGLSLLGTLVMRIVIVPKGKGIATDRQHVLIERMFRKGRYPAYSGQTTIRWADEGLITETELDRCVFYWPSVQEATRSAQHVLVRLALDRFVAVPLIAFRGEEEIAAFIEAVNRRCRRTEAAGNISAPPTDGAR